jgi:hypothetical protein
MVSYCHSVARQIAGRSVRSFRQRISYPQAGALVDETQYALEPPAQNDPVHQHAVFFVRILTE